MTTSVKYLTITAKAPNAKGTFDGQILFNPAEGDADGERVADWADFPKSVPLSYQHAIGGDPGAIIGVMDTTLASDTVMDVKGQLELSSLMAQAVHERMLLPDGDPLALHELSVGFAYDPDKVTKDKNGVLAIHEAELLEISVVYRGAQETKVMNVKALIADVEAGLVSLDRALELAAIEYPPEFLGVGLKMVADAAQKFLDETKEAEVADEQKWDGAAAMQSCSNAADFRKIAFERANDSDPDTAAHWALPHHQSPGADADPQGVSAALGALNGARGGAPDLKDAGAAKSHLEAHANAESNASEEPKAEEIESESKAGRVLSKANETKLRAAADALISAAESIKSVLDTVTSEDGKSLDLEQLPSLSDTVEQMRADAVIEREIAPGLTVRLEPETPQVEEIVPPVEETVVVEPVVEVVVDDPDAELKRMVEGL